MFCIFQCMKLDKYLLKLTFEIEIFTYSKIFLLDFSLDFHVFSNSTIKNELFGLQKIIFDMFSA